jgi:hypothetical protein
MASPPSSRPASASHAEERIMDQPRILPTLTSRLREALHPVVMQNVQLRREYASDKILPQGVQDGTKNLLTDELCESFIGKMQSVRQEMQALKNDEPLNRIARTGIGMVGNHVNGANGSEYVPSSASEVTASTSQRVTRPENGQVPIPYLPTPPISASLTNSPNGMLVRENGWSTTSKVAPTAGRSMSPPYSPSRKGKDRAFENGYMERQDDDLPVHTTNTSLSSSQSKVLPSQYGFPLPNRVNGSESMGIPIPIDPDFFSTPSSSIREGKRRSDSPSPSRYSRPRRTSAFPYLRSPSDRRSRSPYYGSPTPERRSSLQRRHSPSPRHRLSSSYRRQSPRSPHPYASSRAVARSPDRSHSHRPQLSPTRLNGNRRHAHDHLHSQSYSPRYSVDQGLDANPNRNLDAYSKVINTSKDHPILSLPTSISNAEDKKFHLSTVQSTNSTQGLLKPCHNVPGLWFVKTGRNGASITECEFEVDRETAVKWDLDETLP